MSHLGPRTLNLTSTLWVAARCVKPEPEPEPQMPAPILPLLLPMAVSWRYRARKSNFRDEARTHLAGGGPAIFLGEEGDVAIASGPLDPTSHATPYARVGNADVFSDSRLDRGRALTFSCEAHPLLAGGAFRRRLREVLDRVSRWSRDSWQLLLCLPKQAGCRPPLPVASSVLSS